MMGLRVVVVEDDADHLALMVAMLERRCRVVPCNDPSLALETVQHHLPHILLLDIGLPGIDGPTILDLVRATPGISTIPVVAVTADVRRDSEEYWMWRGFDGYMAKPIVDKHLLWSTMDALVRRSALRQP